jgi:hypothetical protein
MATFTDLPTITSATITDSHVFAVATPSTTEQFSLGELQKSMTGITARTTNGLKIYGRTTPSGIFVGDNGFVGIDNNAPTVALDVGDISTDGSAQVRITSSVPGRQASFSLKDSNVLWQTVKKASDTDFYIQASQDGGTTVTGVFNIDVSGNIGVFNGASPLSNKFYVSGGSIKFESGLSGFIFDPGAAEIRTSTAGDIFYINKNTDDDIVLGDNVLYVENGTNSYVGINNITPAYPLDISGSSLIFRMKNGASANSSFAITNTSATGYLNLNSSTFTVGPTNAASNANLAYRLDTRRLGVGTTAPDNKVHVYSSTDTTISKFETKTSAFNQVLQVNNYDSGPTSGPWHSLYTFARYDASLLAPNTSKWAVGLYKNSSYDDVFVWRVDGNTASDAAIKAALDRSGNLDIQGNYTTNSSYCLGKFIQSYETRVTGNCLYFSPCIPNSNINPSGHNSLNAPFTIAPFGGSVEKVQFFSSASAATLSGLSFPLRFEISAISPSYKAGTPANFVSGFSISPPSAGYGVSGIIGYASLNTSDINQNGITTLNKNQFNGTTAFTSGQLLQYRLVNSAGTTTNCDFTVLSSISYTTK